MQKKTNSYDPKRDFSTGDLEVVRDLRAQIRFGKWAMPIAATIFVGLFAFFGWLAKRALVAEIKDLVVPIEKRIERIEVKIDVMEKRQDRLEDKR